MPTCEEIKKFREKHDCSLKEAERSIKRAKFCKELLNNKTIPEVIDTLIRILNFEFKTDEYTPYF